MKKNHLIALLFVLLSFFSSSQTPNWDWVFNVQGASQDGAHVVATDALGNVYIAGYFYGQTIDVGPIALNNASIGGSHSDMFIAKFDSSGTLIWANRAGGDEEDGAYDISTDNLGNVFVTGYFYSSSINFGFITLYNGGDHDMFIVKYDPNGSVLWAKGAGRYSDDYGRAVITDDSNNVYVAGSFKSAEMNFGSTILTNADNSETTYDIFIVKYNSAGGLIWAQSIGSSNDEYMKSLAIDSSGNLISSGHFNSTVLTIDTTTLTSLGSFDIFLTKHNSSGMVIWAKNAGGNDIDYCNSAATDHDGNIYITGVFNSPVLTMDSISLFSASASMYLAKYNPSGDILWAKNATGGGSNGQDIAIDTTGNIFVTGYFAGPTMTLDTIVLSNLGNNDIFVANYNSNGMIAWGTAVGNSGYEEAFSISVHETETYIAGRFQSTMIDFPPFELYNSGADDAFLAKMKSKEVIGINEKVIKEGIEVYPNPFSSQTNITFIGMQKKLKISIVNLLGQEVKNTSFSGDHLILDKGDLKAGVYFIRTMNENNEIYNRKIVIQ